MSCVCVCDHKRSLCLSETGKKDVTGEGIEATYLYASKILPLSHSLSLSPEKERFQRFSDESPSLPLPACGFIQFASPQTANIDHCVSGLWPAEVAPNANRETK